MHTVVFNEGAQTLRHVPYDRHGRPTRIDPAGGAVTYTIVDLREGADSANRVIGTADTTASLGSESEALTAAAGPSQNNPQLLTFADISGFTAGRRYVLESGDGQRELVEIERIDTSGNLMYTLRALATDFTIGATLRAIELEATFPASEANNEDDTVEDGGGPYQITWDYTIDGREYLAPEQIWVRRYSSTPWIGIDDLKRAHPSIDKRASEQVYADAIAIATEEVEAMLEAAGLDPSEYRPSTSGKVMVRNRGLQFVFTQFNGERDERMAEMYGNRFHTLMDQILTKAPRNTVIVSDRDDENSPYELDVNRSFQRP